MPKIEKVLCDQCGKDISGGGPRPGYRLCLNSEPFQNTSGMAYLAMVYPAIEHPRFFCGLDCLCGWAEHTRWKKESRL